MKFFEFVLELATLLTAFSFAWSLIAPFLIMMGGLGALAVFKDNRFLSWIVTATHGLGFALASSAAVYCIEQSRDIAPSPLWAHGVGLLGMSGLISLLALRPSGSSYQRSRVISSAAGLLCFVIFTAGPASWHDHVLNYGMLSVIRVVLDVRVVGEGLGLFALSLLIYSHYGILRSWLRHRGQAASAAPQQSQSDNEDLRKSA